MREEEAERAQQIRSPPTSKAELDRLPEKNLQWFMGITHVKAVVFNLTDSSQRLEIEFLVDSGAMYTIVPARVLISLAIRPHSERVFLLADGRQVTWPVSNAGFAIGERQGASTIVFGSDDTPALLGIATLEELGLGLDPIRRELVPIPLPLFFFP